jgi:uncharacterized protein YbjT (DUF2867 family)
MKIVVIGGTGLIGSKLVENMRAHGRDAVPASPSSGVNTLTGEGLTEGVAGADVVVDVSNSPSFEDAAVREFFETSTRNILDAEAAAGVGHHVALSVVGAERLTDSGYMRAKIAQEALIKDSSIPYTIVHATQFFEFAARIADDASDGDTVRVPPVLIQPMAAEDVAAAVCDVALAAPLNGIIEIGGPEPLPFDEFVRQGLRSVGDQRVVVADPRARYFGAQLSERTLVPGAGARLAGTRFATGSARGHLGSDHVRRHPWGGDPRLGTLTDAKALHGGGRCSTTDPDWSPDAPAHAGAGGPDARRRHRTTPIPVRARP